MRNAEGDRDVRNILTLGSKRKLIIYFQHFQHIYNLNRLCSEMDSDITSDLFLVLNQWRNWLEHAVLLNTRWQHSSFQLFIICIMFAFLNVWGPGSYSTGFAEHAHIRCLVLKDEGVFTLQQMGLQWHYLPVSVGQEERRYQSGWRLYMHFGCPVIVRLSN